MTDKVWDVNSIQDAMRRRGSHWWDPDTMRFFGCQVAPTVYQGPGGVFFVTSEWDGFNGRETGRRAYTVRKFLPEQADVETVGEMGQHATRKSAVKVARGLASLGAAVPGAVKPAVKPLETKVKHKPVAVLEQFMDDCKAHGVIAVLDDIFYRELITKAALHHLYMEKLCSDELFCKRINAEGEHPLVLQLRKQIAARAEVLGCGVIFSGDPRGCTCKLMFKDGFTNDFGKEGYCIPTSLKGDDE